MKLFLLIFICFFSLSWSSACTNPVYILSARNGKSLDLTPFTTCTRGTKPTVTLNRKFSTWCVNVNQHILYNEKDCALHLYGSTENYFIGIFPQAMMNWNNLVWDVKTTGDGFFAIHSPSNGNYVLSLKQSGLVLEPYTGALRQKWIIIPNIN